MAAAWEAATNTCFPCRSWKKATAYGSGDVYAFLSLQLEESDGLRQWRRIRVSLAAAGRKRRPTAAATYTRSPWPWRSRMKVAAG